VTSELIDYERVLRSIKYKKVDCKCNKIVLSHYPRK